MSSATRCCWALWVKDVSLSCNVLLEELLLTWTVTDMMLTPAMLGHQKYLLGDKAIETDVAHCVYGEELCATAAKLSHELSWKVLRSAESYLCFALSVFMFRNGFDFMQGHLKNTPLIQHSTESNLWTESTLADCPYRVGGEQ